MLMEIGMDYEEVFEDPWKEKQHTSNIYSRTDVLGWAVIYAR